MKRVPRSEFLAYLDAHPKRYKDQPEPDGYNPTRLICARLVQRPKVPNPKPAAKVPKPMDIDALYAALYTALSDEEIAAIGVDGFGLIHDAIDAGDRLRVKRLVNVAGEGGWIPEAKRNAIIAQVDAEIDDPSYQSQIRDQSEFARQWGSLPGQGLSRAMVDQYLERT